MDAPLKFFRSLLPVDFFPSVPDWAVLRSHTFLPNPVLKYDVILANGAKNG